MKMRLKKAICCKFLINVLFEIYGSFKSIERFNKKNPDNMEICKNIDSLKFKMKKCKKYVVNLMLFIYH